MLSDPSLPVEVPRGGDKLNTLPFEEGFFNPRLSRLKEKRNNANKNKLNPGIDKHGNLITAGKHILNQKQARYYKKKNNSVTFSVKLIVAQAAVYILDLN